MTPDPPVIQNEQARSLASAAYIAARYAGLDHNDAQDVSQEAFARISSSTSYSGFEHAERVKIIRGIVRHIAIDRVRRTKAKTVDMDAAAPVIAPNHASGLDVRDRVTRLLAALRTLQQADQDVLVLRYVYGLSHRQIGVVLSVQEDAARARVFRAEARLKDIAGPID